MRMSKRRIGHWRPAKDAGEPDSTAASDLAYWDHAESDDLLDADELDDAISHLYEDGGPALARWKDRLSQYVDLQGTLDALRLRPSSEQPWPAFDNPMLGYLKERTTEIVAKDGLEAAITWIAANAWFEGALAERSRFIRLIDADD
jgi:hypothetical protein